MKKRPGEPETDMERGFRRLMLSVGCVMMITPTAEMVVQLSFGERPQVLLLGGFFLVGLLTVSHSLSSRPAARSRLAPPGVQLRTERRRGDALWVPEDEKRTLAGDRPAASPSPGDRSSL